MSSVLGKRALVLIYSQTFPIYPEGSARDESKYKTLVENPSIGDKRDVDVICLEQFFRNLYNGEANIFVKNDPSFANTKEDIKKRIQSDNKYDCFLILFLTFVDNQKRLQFNEPNFEQGLQEVDVFVSLVMDLEKEINGKPVIFLIQADDLTLLEEKVKHKAVGFEGDEHNIMLSSNRGFLLIMSTIPQKITAGKESLLVRAFVDAMERNLAEPDQEQKDMATLMNDIKDQVKEMVAQSNSSRANDMPEPVVINCLVPLTGCDAEDLYNQIPVVFIGVNIENFAFNQGVGGMCSNLHLHYCPRTGSIKPSLS